MLNHWTGMGRLTADPELKKTPSGVSVVQFTVAIDRGYTGQNGEKQTDFLDIVAWRNTADFIAKYFSKGSMICIEGSVQKRSYETTDNQKRYVVEIIADRVHFAGSNTNSNNQATTESVSAPSGLAGFTTADEDLPF